MPNIYLSPSTQQANLYVTGGTEEHYMNLVADAMEPYLRSSGIQFTRNTPAMTAASSIRQSNAGNYDLHLSLHSNAAPEGRYGQKRGSEVYYYPASTKGQRAATIIANNLRTIYPGSVRTIATTSLGEVRKTYAPSVLVEFAYHDNPEDANWIKNNIDAIAVNVVQSLTQYFGIPFVTAQALKYGTVDVSSGRLNIRKYPNTGATIIAKANDGAPIAVLGAWQGWYVVNYNGTVGYADSRYINT